MVDKIASVVSPDEAYTTEQWAKIIPTRLARRREEEALRAMTPFQRYNQRQKPLTAKEKDAARRMTKHLAKGKPLRKEGDEEEEKKIIENQKLL